MKGELRLTKLCCHPESRRRRGTSQLPNSASAKHLALINGYACRFAVAHDRLRGPSPSARLGMTRMSSQIEQLKLARHLRGNSFGVIINPADRGDVSRRQADRGRDEIMIRQNAIRPVHPDPAGPGKKNLRPGMERSLGPLGLRVAFAQITTR